MDLFWMLLQEIEEAIQFKLGRFADEDDWDLKDTNDFLEIIRELKHQIFLVFREAGTHINEVLKNCLVYSLLHFIHLSSYSILPIIAFHSNMHISKVVQFKSLPTQIHKDFPTPNNSMKIEHLLNNFEIHTYISVETQ